MASLSGKITFSDNRVGAVDQYEVFSMAPDGSDQRQITSELSNYSMHPTASPNGQQLAYERWDQNPFTGSLANVKIAGTDGANATQLRTGSERSRSSSPDGQRIALVTTLGLVVVSPDGSSAVTVRPWYASELLNEPMISPQAWAPNGQSILISQQPGIGVGVSQEVWRVSVVDGSVLWRANPPSEYPSASVDGWVALQSDFDGNYNIYVVDPTGATFRLTDHPARDWKPVWSPDGSRLLFVSNRDGNDEIYMIHHDGTGLTNLTRHAAAQTDPCWVP